jgi:hypothetical protein
MKSNKNFVKINKIWFSSNFLFFLIAIFSQIFNRNYLREIDRFISYLDKVVIVQDFTYMIVIFSVADS